MRRIKRLYLLAHDALLSLIGPSPPNRTASSGSSDQRAHQLRQRRKVKVELYHLCCLARGERLELSYLRSKRSASTFSPTPHRIWLCESDSNRH